MSVEKNFTLSVVLCHFLTQIIDVFMPHKDISLLSDEQKEPVSRLAAQAKLASNMLTDSLEDKTKICVDGILCELTQNGLNAAARILNDAAKTGQFSQEFMKKHQEDNKDFSTAMDFIGNLLKMADMGGSIKDPNMVPDPHKLDLPKEWLKD